MSNHCDDVMCLQCGRAWCTRGCSFHLEPSEERLKSFLEERQSFANKFNNGKMNLLIEKTRCICGGETTSC